jgi:hypothetical protein
MLGTLLWKPDWPEARRNLVRWWRGEGMALYLTAWRESPRQEITAPPEPADMTVWWTDPAFRLQRDEYMMVSQDFLAEAIPYFDTQIGPGSLGIILGSKPVFVEGTVWYKPVITDPLTYGSVRFNPQDNVIYAQHMALIETGLQHAAGRYLVGIPDLIENLDTLAALRGDHDLLFDLIERPEWVSERLAEINQAYFEVFNAMFEKVKDAYGGNCFSAFAIWGPGKTAKLQCDISATISPKMFRRFVSPHLQAQCRWLDFSLYHLDGTTCLQHVEPLLEIDGLNAIEWTPQAGKPGGGSPEWYDLYRRIRAGGKGVQAIGVEPEEVVPLLDAVGPQGLYILLSRICSQAEAELLLKAVESYRR